MSLRSKSAAISRIVSLILLLTSLSPQFVDCGASAAYSRSFPVPASSAHNYDIQHYRIEVSFDWQNESVSGETTISLRPLFGDLNEIDLDAGKMKINSVRLAEGAPLTFRYVGGQRLFVALDRGYPPGQEISISINYSATPERGLVFIKPTASDPRRPYQIWSQGEARDNHYWFPCYDHPDDKATSELIATVDQKYEVISNGSLVDVHAAARGARTWHWKMDKPFSSYLISVIVGRFAQVRQQFKGRPVISYVYPDQIGNARISFGKLASMVGFMSRELDFDYPYSRYSETTVRDFDGGMENITATTLTDTVIHDRRAHLDVSSDDLIAHELAHSWFGNMVTCREWSDIWLHESFASFFEALWTEHDRGHDDYLYTVFTDQQAYFQAWYQGLRRPMITSRYDNPDALFDAYAYQRGAAALNMLRFVLGEEPFRAAIRHYLKKFQWQNVDTSQFAAAIQESTGQNLDWFFDEWLYKMGHPEFEITANYDGAHTLRLKVTQPSRPPTTAEGYEHPSFFTMPVDIAITTISGEHIHRVLIDGKEKEFTFEVDARPLIINFDRGNYLIKQVKFDRTDQDLAYQLTNDADVMGRVQAAIQLRTKASEVAIKALSDAAVGDRFWGVRLEAVRSLAAVRNESSRNALQRAAGDRDSRIRRAAFQGLAGFKDARLVGLFTKAVKNDPSYFSVADAAGALGETGSPRAFRVLTGLIRQRSWQDVLRTGALRGLLALRDPRSLDMAIKYARAGNSDGVRALAFHLVATTGKGSDRALESLAAALNESPKIATDALASLRNLGDPRAIPALEEFRLRPDAWPSSKQLATVIINELRNSNKQANERE